MIYEIIFSTCKSLHSLHKITEENLTLHNEKSLSVPLHDNLEDGNTKEDLLNPEEDQLLKNDLEKQNGNVRLHFIKLIINNNYFAQLMCNFIVKKC